VGYGDVVPANAAEHVFCVIYMALSQMFAAWIFANLAWLTAMWQQSESEYHAVVVESVAILAKIGASPSVKERVLAYQEFVERQLERRLQLWLNGLSRPLREELRIVLYHDLVSKAPFLQEQPPHILRRMIMSLVDCCFLPCDIVIRRGDTGTEMFFVRRGTLGVFTSKDTPNWSADEIHSLITGSYFGEIALLTDGVRRSWVVARTYATCSSLAKKAVDETMSMYPGCISGIVNCFKNELLLRSTTTLATLANRLFKKFKGEAAVVTYFNHGLGDQALMGQITWQRFEALLEKLQIDRLDVKLLWIELQPTTDGTLDIGRFMEKMNFKHQNG
jgi:CRP-like cAMP-binding protein